jgi:protease PrsW
MPILFSAIAAFLPMMVYLLIIWRLDKNEREPLKNVLLHFLWGAFGATIVGISVSFVLSFFSSFLESNSKLMQTVIYAPIVEEISKGFFLLYSMRSKEFDNITDGIVYGASIGLGFGMNENLVYFITYGTNPTSWIYLVVIRTFFSAVMHCISTATFGAFLGMAKFSSSRWKKILPFIGLVCAILFHFMWNGSVSFEETYSLGFLFMILLMLAFFTVFKISLYQEKRIIETELEEESILGIIPSTHIKILSSHLRFKKGWFDERFRKLYYSYAIHLAFCKNQLKNTENSLHEYYLSEVEKKREAIRSLLSNNYIVS